MLARNKVETLVKWFEENEIEWEKDMLEVKDTNNSLGVFAKKDIEEGSPGECAAAPQEQQVLNQP